MKSKNRTAGGCRTYLPETGLNLRFPGAPFDCESLFVWEGCGHVVSKVFDNARAQIFRFPLKETNRPLTLELVATTKIESPVTGADLWATDLLARGQERSLRVCIDGDVTRISNANPHHTKLENQHIEGAAWCPRGCW